jgi:hypothetical protein
MRRFSLFIALAAAAGLVGCHSNPPAPTATPSRQPDGRSLADMEAEYSKMRQKYLADCIQGSPEHIRANQSLCETERQKMAPLGNALAEAEQKAAQQHTNP